MSKVRIWSVDPPGSLHAALFGADGMPRDSADGSPRYPYWNMRSETCSLPVVKLKASYVETAPGQFPVGPLLRADQIAKYGRVVG